MMNSWLQPGKGENYDEVTFPKYLKRELYIGNCILVLEFVLMLLNWYGIVGCVAW